MFHRSVIKTPFVFFHNMGIQSLLPALGKNSVNITSKAVWLVELPALRHSRADTPHLQKPARRSEVASLVNGLLSLGRATREVL